MKAGEYFFFPGPLCLTSPSMIYYISSNIQYVTTHRYQLVGAIIKIINNDKLDAFDITCFFSHITFLRKSKILKIT